MKKGLTWVLAVVVLVIGGLFVIYKLRSKPGTSSSASAAASGVNASGSGASYSDPTAQRIAAGAGALKSLTDVAGALSGLFGGSSGEEEAEA